MDVWAAIRNRRSIRKFTDDPVEDEVLKNLVLEAGIWAPSGGNAQAWRFLVITDPKILHKVKLVSPGLLGTFTSVIVVCQDLAHALEKGGEWRLKTLCSPPMRLAWEPAQSLLFIPRPFRKLLVCLHTFTHSF